MAAPARGDLEPYLSGERPTGTPPESPSSGAPEAAAASANGLLLIRGTGSITASAAAAMLFMLLLLYMLSKPVKLEGVLRPETPPFNELPRLAAAEVADPPG